MEILYVLLVLLVVTRFCGEIAVRLKQPALVGELVSGIVLGVVVRAYSGSFPVLAGLADDEVFLAITDLGVFFLMLLAGLEMRPSDVVKSSGGALAVAVSGLLVPLAVGFGLAWVFIPASEVKLAQAMFVGTALAITAVPVAVRVLMDLKRLESRPGKMIVAAALFDDVMSLVVLAVLTALIQTGGFPDAAGFAWLAARTVAFFAISILLGYYVFPLIGRWVKSFQLEEFDFSTLLVKALGLSVLAEVLELHFILGAFMAGLFFSRRTIDQQAFFDTKKKVSGITTGFLAPIFFASIGLHLELSAVMAIPGFLSLLVAAAFLTKLIGSAVPAYFSGLSRKASLAVGVAMSARGAVELIIADIALRAGLFNQPDPPPDVIAHMFSAIVIVAVVTTVAVPIVLRVIVSEEDAPSEEEEI